MTSTEIRKNRLDLIAIIGTIGTFLLLGYLFWPALKDIARVCWTDDDYSHGLLLPFVALYMIWDRREAIGEKLRVATTLGEKEHLFVAELVLLVGLFGLFIAYASGILFAGWVAFFPAVLATIYLVFGRTAAFCLAPPILLLYMAKPIPDSVVVRLFWPLQVLAAKVSAVVLHALHVPTYIRGNIIEIPQMKLLVEEACSGMRSVMSLLTLALIVIYFVPLRFLSKILLIVAALGVAICLNIVRVAITGILAHFYDPSTATGFFHTFSGLVVFIVALPVLYYIGVLLTKLDARAAAPRSVA